MEITEIKDLNNSSPGMVKINGQHIKKASSPEVVAWLAVEENELTPEFTESELSIREAQSARAGRLDVARKRFKAYKDVLEEFHVITQELETSENQAAANMIVFKDIMAFLQAGSDKAKSLMLSVDLTDTNLSEAHRLLLVKVYEDAIA